MKKFLASQTLQELAQWCEVSAFPKFRAKQIKQWITAQFTAVPEEMRNLPSVLRNKLAEDFFAPSMKVKEIFSSSDDVEKFLLELHDGELIEMALRNVAPDLPFKAVRATRGKYLRAEPIAALYEQNKVHHTGIFSELEEEMCNYTPQNNKSPDRLDALVWALTHLSSSNTSARTILA